MINLRHDCDQSTTHSTTGTRSRRTPIGTGRRSRSLVYPTWTHTSPRRFVRAGACVGAAIIFACQVLFPTIEDASLALSFSSLRRTPTSSQTQAFLGVQDPSTTGHACYCFTGLDHGQSPSVCRALKSRAHTRCKRMRRHEGWVGLSTGRANLALILLSLWWQFLSHALSEIGNSAAAK